MPRLGCLFCKRKQRLFKISMIYDQTGSPIKNYIVEFLGPCEQYLQDDQGVCSACVFVLNKLLYLKKCMYLIIASARENHYNNTPYFKFSYVYKHFLDNLQKLSYEDCESDNAQNLSELLRPLHSSPYEEEREAEYDREVQNALRQRRNRGRTRRRGHNWTRHKGAHTRSRSRLTTYSEPAHGTHQRHSTVFNYSEYYDSNRSGSDADDNDREVALSFENAGEQRNGALPNRRPYTPSTIRTYSTYSDDVSVDVPPKYKCINNCFLEFDNLKDLTNHKIEDHGMLANYVCYECYDTKFATPEDLKLHNELLHHTLISHCFLCSLELRTTEDLQNHLREHKFQSYPCNYCDMFFLDRQTCKTHIAECHKGKRKRIRRITQCTIIDRIYRSIESSPVHVPQSPDKYNNQIIWRLQKLPLVEKLSALCLDVIKRFHQGTVDISNLTKSSYSNNTVMKVADYLTEKGLEVLTDILYNEDEDTEVSSEIFDGIEEDVATPVMETEMTESTNVEPISMDISTENLTDGQQIIFNGTFASCENVVYEEIETDTNNLENIDSLVPGSSDGSSSNTANDSTNPLFLTTVDHFEKFVTTNNVPVGAFHKNRSKENIEVQCIKKSDPQNARLTPNVPVDFGCSNSESDGS